MYKGNMYEFVDKLDNYLRTNNLGRLFGPFYDTKFEGDYYIEYWGEGYEKYSFQHYVEDSEDFEENIFNRILRKLKQEPCTEETSQPSSTS